MDRFLFLAGYLQVVARTKQKQGARFRAPPEKIPSLKNRERDLSRAAFLELFL